MFDSFAGWLGGLTQIVASRPAAELPSNPKIGEAPVDFTVVSFYCGDNYYHLAALELKRDCDRLGIPNHIIELELPSGHEWDYICRQKIKFYKNAMASCGTPIVWVDVDCRISNFPSLFVQSRFDIIGYLRRFTAPRDFHLSEVARFWTPSILYFNHNERALRFIEYMCRLEAESQIRATDDFFLEEAWRTFSENLAIGILPPDTVAQRPEDVTERTHFVFGSSGNVSSYKSQVEQHTSLIDTPRHQQAVLENCAKAALAKGEVKDALVLSRCAFYLDGSNHAVAFRYAEALQRTGDYQKASEVLQTCALDPSARPIALKRLINLKFRDPGDALQKQAFLEKMTQDSDQSVAALAKARLFRLNLDLRADEQGLRKADRVPLWWMETPFPGNVGDLLNPYVVEKVTGVPPLYKASGARMLAIGSIVKFAERGVQVWGAGTPRMTDKLSAEAEYLAVRGPLTRELVNRSGGRCPDVYGDPALLLPMIYPSKGATPRHKLGLIRHFEHRDVQICCEGVKDISVIRCGYDEIETFIDEVLDCERIISTSLHGIIIAQAYGIPARWATFSKSKRMLPGDGTKFADHFLSIHMPVQEVLDLSEISEINESLYNEINSCVDLKFNAQRLLSSFPAHWIRESQLSAA